MAKKRPPTLKEVKHELKLTIGKLAHARGVLYTILLDPKKSKEWLRELKLTCEETAGDSSVLSYREVAEGFRMMERRINHDARSEP